MKLKLNRVYSWAFIGVGSGIDMYHDVPHMQPHMHGWNSTQDRFVYEAYYSTEQPRWSSGDCVLVKADLSTNIVSMMSTKSLTPDTFCLRASAQPYVFCVILIHDDDDVELIPVSVEDEVLLA